MIENKPADLSKESLIDAFEFLDKVIPNSIKLEYFLTKKEAEIFSKLNIKND